MTNDHDNMNPWDYEPTNYQKRQEPVTTDVTLPDRYEFAGESFVGGMGVVYRARDRKLPREVAVKRILPEFLDDNELVARFRKEAEAIAQLSHPNLVTILDYGDDDAGPFIVMKWLSGGSLKAKLESDRVISPENAADIFGKLADGLFAAHEHGIIHRDIKPGNILFDQNQNPVVVDFGIVRTESQTTADTTLTGGLLGTIKYMAPEQERDPRAVSALSDMWSLGATLYESLTGQSVKGMRESLIPSNIRPIVLRALDHAPRNRFESMKEFANALESVSGRGKTVGSRLDVGECADCSSRNSEQNKCCTTCGAALWGSCLNSSCSNTVAVWELFCGQCGNSQEGLKKQISAELNAIVEECSDQIRKFQFPEARKLAHQLADDERPQLKSFQQTGTGLLSKIENESKAAVEEAAVNLKDAQARLDACDFEKAFELLTLVPEPIRDDNHAAITKLANEQKERHAQNVKLHEAELSDLVERFEKSELFQTELFETVSDRVKEIAKRFEDWKIDEWAQSARGFENEIGAFFDQANGAFQDSAEIIRSWPSENECREAAERLKTLPIEFQQESAPLIQQVEDYRIQVEALQEIVANRQDHTKQCGLCGYQLLLQPYTQVHHRGFDEWREKADRETDSAKEEVDQLLADLQASSDYLINLAATGKVSTAHEQINNVAGLLYGESEPRSENLVADLVQKVDEQARVFDETRVAAIDSATQLREQRQLLSAISHLEVEPICHHDSVTKLIKEISDQLEKQKIDFEQFQTTAPSEISENRVESGLNFLGGLAVSIEETKRWRNLKTIFDWLYRIQTEVNGLTLAATRFDVRKVISKSLRTSERLRKARAKSQSRAELVAVYDAALEKFDKGVQYLKTRIPPPHLSFPFSAKTAARAQQAWATHLGLEAEVTNAIGMAFRVIPPGKFMKGSPNTESGRRKNEEQCEVTIEQPLLVAVVPVSETQRSKINKRFGSVFQRMKFALHDDTSAVEFSLIEAEEFVHHLNAFCPIPGWRYRVPTDSEWEYACRAGSAAQFNLSKALMNCKPFGPGHQIVPGQFPPNAFGLCDMHGNVWEWCVAEAPTIRGGSFETRAEDCRSARSKLVLPDQKSKDTGVRLVCELECLSPCSVEEEED